VIRLHPSQSRAYTDPARFRIVVAGRRWGKTYLAIAVLLSWIGNSKRADARVCYIAPTYKEARDILWDQLKAQIPAGWLSKAPNESRLELDFTNGARLGLYGADNPFALKGRGFDGVVFDEFATMKPEAWTEAIRPALSDRAGKALFIGTPQAYNHLHALYVRGQSRDPEDVDYASWQFKTIDGAVEPWGPMARQEVEDAKRDLDTRTYRQEYEASFENLSGRVYYAFDRKSNVLAVELDPGSPAHLSFDFNINPATAVIGQASGGFVRVWREVYLEYLGGDATVSAARECKRLLAQAGHRSDVRVYGDSTGKSGKTTGPSDHQVLKSEFPGATWCIPKDQPHVRDRIASVNTLCATHSGLRRMSIDPSCKRLIADLEQVQFKENGEVDKSTNGQLTHVSDALGYWLVKDYPVVKRKVTVGGMNWGVD
jgi:hypothetical protein